MTRLLAVMTFGACVPCGQHGFSISMAVSVHLVTVALVLHNTSLPADDPKPLPLMESFTDVPAKVST